LATRIDDYTMTPAQIETARRIRVAVWAYAYAYEILSVSIVDDFTFDQECQKVDLAVDTARPDLDVWFRENFDPCTGSWVHCHPEKALLSKVAREWIKRAGIEIPGGQLPDRL
jgi:hypothetical protein